QLWLAEVRKQSKKRALDLPPALNLFYCLALIGSHDPQQYPQLKQAVALGLKKRHGMAYEPLQQLLEKLQGTRLHSALPAPLHPPSGLDGLVHALALHWLEAP